MTKILLVDDSKFCASLRSGPWLMPAMKMSSALDGEQALEIARKDHLDLILLDMLLPKLTGPEVLKSLKKDPRTADIPVVVFSGLSHKNAARLEHDGAFGYLEKTELGLDKGCQALLAAVADIVKRLPARKTEPAVDPAKAAKQVTAGRPDGRDKQKSITRGTTG